MPDVTLWDVAAGVRTTWAAASSLTAIVPAARLYFGRAAEETPLPYAAFTFQDVSAYFGGTEYFSGQAYVKVTRVNFDVYGTHATDWQTLAQVMADTFGWSASDPNASWSIPNATILSAMPEVEGVEVTDVRVDGQDVVKYSTNITLTMQADRG
jgi:hypothetical protein